jgi:hypothetical protein
LRGHGDSDHRQQFCTQTAIDTLPSFDDPSCKPWHGSSSKSLTQDIDVVSPVGKFAGAAAKTRRQDAFAITRVYDIVTTRAKAKNAGCPASIAEHDDIRNGPVKDLRNVEANHRGTKIRRFVRAGLDAYGAADKHHVSRFDGEAGV